VSSELLACPFCRELYRDEQLVVCPHCDVPLKPLRDLPPSYEIREAEALEWERTAPADRKLPWNYWSRGRGLLLVLSVLGFAAAFAPWIVMTKPENMTLTALQLARTKGMWFGGSMVGWFVAMPLVWTRRTITKLRGARIAVTMFAALPVGQILILALNAPTTQLIPVSYTWGWGFYLSAAVGLLALPFALRLGGSVDDLPADLGKELVPDAKAESSDGQTLH
jgi:MFS family permease